MTPATAGLLVGGIAALRAATTGHAPDTVDAACALALVAAVAALPGAAPPAILVAAVVVAAAALASAPLSFDPFVTLLALPVVVGPCAALVVGAALPSSARARVLVGVAAGGLLNALAAAHQRFVTWPDALARREELGLLPEQVARLASLRPLGLSLSPDLLGALCLGGAAAALALAAPVDEAPRPRPARVAAIAVAAVCLGGAALSRGFGTALAAGVGVAAYALTRARDRRVVLGGAIAAVAVGAAAIAARGASALALSAGERVENWRAALAILADHPVVGVGLARFAPAYLAVRSEHANVTRYAHSFPLQWSAETGVVGALALVVAVALIAPRARRGAPFVVAGAAAMVARWAWDYDGHVGQTATIAALLVGLAIAPSSATPSRRGRIAAVVVAALLAGVAAISSSRDAALAAYRPGGADPTPVDDVRLRAWAARFPGDLEAQVRAGERGDVEALRRAAATGHAPVHVYLRLAQIEPARRDELLAAARRVDPWHQALKPPTN